MALIPEIPSGPQPSKTLYACRVAFNKPAFLGPEIEEIRKAIQTYNQISGVGHNTLLCEKSLAQRYQAPCLLTSSCTHALEMAALLLDLSPGDEVILPSYTFVSTANAFALRGATVKFVDCDRYGQLDLESVKRQVSPRTRAVCVVHYAGNSTNMDALSQFCAEHRLALVEDAAQAIGALYQGRALGTWGDLACLSFHETKNITSGEGGALIVNNPALLERAQYIREKGTNRTRFVEGLVDKYTWVDLGSSYVLSDMNAAHLWVQLENLDKINARRQQIWERYAHSLQPLLQPATVSMLETPSGNTPNYHLFALVFEEPEYRTAFINFMRQRDIVTPFHYVPLHSSPMGQQLSPELVSDASEPFLNTFRLARGLVRLPIFYNMTDQEQDWVIASIAQFLREHQ